MSTPVPTLPTAPIGGEHESGRRPPSHRRGLYALGFVALVAGIIGASGPAAIMLASGALETKTVTVTAPVTRAPATGAPLAARAVYESAAAGVVEITCRVTTQVTTPFGQQERSGIESGTGSLIDSKGRILTAEHVVAGATSISVTLIDGTRRAARVLGRDAATDIAVLQIDAKGLDLHAIPLGSIRSLAVGDPLYVIGNPFGYPRSFSSGLVSALDRTIEAPNGFQVAHAIQTDAALNPGNSGGPVLDARGRMIGVADQIATGATGVGTSTGVGFAVAIDLVESALPQLVRGVTPVHAYLGVGAADTTVSGPLIRSISANGPAARAGLRAGDRIVLIDGSRISGVSELVAVLAVHSPGERVAVTVRRGSATHTLDVTLGRQPETAVRR
jgi:putative serine protease PepD